MNSYLRAFSSCRLQEGAARIIYATLAAQPCWLQSRILNLNSHHSQTDRWVSATLLWLRRS